MNRKENSRRAVGPQVARISIATLQAARALTDPALHYGERWTEAERVSALLDGLIDTAKWAGEPLP